MNTHHRSMFLVLMMYRNYFSETLDNPPPSFHVSRCSPSVKLLPIHSQIFLSWHSHKEVQRWLFCRISLAFYWHVTCLDIYRNRKVKDINFTQLSCVNNGHIGYNKAFELLYLEFKQIFQSFLLSIIWSLIQMGTLHGANND